MPSSTTHNQMDPLGFLKQVIDLKARDLIRAKQNISLATVRRDAETMAPCPDFAAALGRSTADDIGIIAEIKKASPSKGDIRADLNIEDHTRAYEAGGARAVSVLTESHFFKGSLGDLEQVCGLTLLPVLRKDFVISSYQIFEARRAGAAAVLLITTSLSRGQLTDYISLTREIGMTPLVEVTSEREFEIAYDCNARVVDINNRNLQTLEVTPNASRRIGAIIPEDVIGVAASGISGREDMLACTGSRLYNFLVGESLVRANEPEALLTALRGGASDDS